MDNKKRALTVEELSKKQGEYVVVTYHRNPLVMVMKVQGDYLIDKEGKYTYKEKSDDCEIYLLENYYSNIGADEHEGVFGNCLICGCKGVNILNHACSKKEPIESNSVDEETLKDIQRMLIQWASYIDDVTGNNPWEDNTEFKKMANKYGFTKENIYSGFEHLTY